MAGCQNRTLEGGQTASGERNPQGDSGGLGTTMLADGYDSSGPGTSRQGQGVRLPHATPSGPKGRTLPTSGHERTDQTVKGSVEIY